ncbi:hypothetical protein ACFW93_07870 [Streptomyces canus]|uniref:hypothetical protein n=1 Tax=Streptomyces canus TaxID=58343 RepID=UPI0036BDF2F5
MNIKQARPAMAHHAFCGLARQHLGESFQQLVPRWEARCASVRHERRQGSRAARPTRRNRADYRHTIRQLMAQAIVLGNATDWTNFVERNWTGYIGSRRSGG